MESRGSKLVRLAQESESSTIVKNQGNTDQQESSASHESQATDSVDGDCSETSSSSSSSSSDSDSTSSSDSGASVETSSTQQLESNLNSSAISNDVLLSTPKKVRKRQRQPEKWKKTITKILKNSGQEYVSRTGKTVKAKTIGPPCKCKLLCATKFSDIQRTQLFQTYWALGSLQKQRCFLSSCVVLLEVKYRRIKATGAREARRPNCSFFLLNEGKNIRVCKPFLIRTLGITERTIRTVIKAKTEGTGVIPNDKRGKHNKHVKLDKDILDSVRNHINSIPRIESHYLRASTSRQFIDGGLTIAEMHRNYKTVRESENKLAANYDAYSRIFNTEFNIGFFVPKKDQCDQCEAYKNATGEEKIEMKKKYEHHLEEKNLSRIEKKTDIEECKKPGSATIVAIYDLQAVLSCPIGESSAYFYKSKLNCYNFTVSDIRSNSTNCFFWHEGLANRGAIEIGTCVLKFLKEIATKHPNSDIIFYSDNCCGQQKNRFILAMYYFAVATLELKSVTHKFLIRGHTQNEGDTAHSVIEKTIKKAKKSGPIYVPDQYVSLIRNAKKTGKPFSVTELSYSDFLDIKSLADDIGFNTSKDINGQPIKLSEMKIVQFDKESDTYKYKTSYNEDWIEAKISLRRATTKKNINEIKIKPAYTSKITISGRKKSDLQQLLSTNIVPKFYEGFYNSLF